MSQKIYLRCEKVLVSFIVMLILVTPIVITVKHLNYIDREYNRPKLINYAEIKTPKRSLRPSYEDLLSVTNKK